MRVHAVEQGSPEWVAVRLGIPTASQFDRILTPTGKRSAQADAYARELVAERFLGQPCADMAGSPWMERGTFLEAEARAWYEFTREVAVERVGFITDDAGRWGCSPDALVGEDGLLEVKCPAAVTHVGYLLGGLGRAYRVQVQGQLWVTGRRWADLLSYCPGFTAPLDAHVERVERDEAFIAALAEAVEECAAAVDAGEAELRKMVTT